MNLTRRKAPCDPRSRLDGGSVRAALVPVLLALACAGAPDIAAQTYSSDWRKAPAQTGAPAPAGRSPAIDALIRDLDRLTEAAARQRAADPGFLNDLRELSRRYSWPWRNRVVHDDFSDGNHTSAPAWTTGGGASAVTADGFALTPVRETPVRETPASTGTSPDSQPEDLGRALLGGILRELAREQQSGRRGGAAPPQDPPRYQPATAVLRQPISNSFAIRLVLAPMRASGGSLEFGVGQGDRGLGYFLVYRPGATPGLSLERRGSRGAAVIEAGNLPAAANPGMQRTLQLTRNAAGEMETIVDGVSVFRVTDRAFRSNFDRFAMTARDEPFTVRTVSVYAAP